MKKIILCEIYGGDKFIPQINKIKGNEYILNKLNSFKIGYNNQFLDYFYDDKLLNSKKLLDFCKNYGKKIKEITFMDMKDNNNFSVIDKYIYKYIIINSDIQKVEDRYFYNDNNNLSEFMKLFDLDYEDFFKNINKELLKIHQKNKLNDIIRGLKSYSLYYDNIHNNKINQLTNPLFIFMMNNGINIENLQITIINEPQRLSFINSIKKIINLKSLIISKNSDIKLYNCISEIIKEDSLYILEINLNNFQEGYNIINKNKNSLIELTLKIEYSIKDNITILKTLSDIKNLKKLKLICEFQILNEDNIKYFHLKKVEYLEIPLYINTFLFDLNIFFGNVPKLKKLIFNGINFNENNEINQENINRINGFVLNINLIKKLKKINFYNSEKSASFFIIKLINCLSKSKIKENIKEIKFQNCDFDKNINFNNLIVLLSSFYNIKKLSLNYISFIASEPINYNEINNFSKLEKFYFKGLNYEQNEIKILFFLYKFAEKCQKLNELGFSCRGLNPYDINLIFKIIKNYRFLTKLNIFDNYSKDDYYTNEVNDFYPLGINIGEIIDYCLFDLKSIDFKIEKKWTYIKILQKILLIIILIKTI